MNITSANVASKLLSTVIERRPTRWLCHSCGRFAFSPIVSTLPHFSLGTDKHRVRHYSEDSSNRKWKFQRPVDSADDNLSDSSGSGKYKLTGLQGIAGKYQVFQDFDSPIILDVDEERALRRSNPEQLEEVVSKLNPYAEMNLEHGKTGVFDINELVDVLRMENAQDIVVISVPAERQYVDYLTIVTGKSTKHVWALSEFVRGLYKRRKYEHEPVPQLEGEKECEWLAMDLGNIALHVFTRKARKFYDLEILWSVGHKYDDLVHKKEESYIQLLEQHTHPALMGLTPADAEPTPQLAKSSGADSCEFPS